MATVSTIETLFAILVSGDNSILPVLEDAILEGVTDAPKGVTYVVIERRAFVRNGITTPAQRMSGHFAVVTKNKSIRLVGAGSAYPSRGCNNTDPGWDRTFEIGDTCEESSYNLTYFGTVSTVSEKKIGVLKERGNQGQRSMMDLDVFSSRNCRIDIESERQRNREWRD